MNSSKTLLILNFLKLLIRLAFPTVRQINTQDFACWQLDSAKPQPFVLDARTQAEYTVSHLKAAVQINSISPDLAALTVSKDTPIVVYCSIGYRSAKTVQQLQSIGFSCVFNLSGGLFQWANEGQPMFRDAHPTQLVHPYNAMWGKLLKDSYRIQQQ